LYTGLQASISTVIAKNQISGGVYGYAQHENDLFGAVFNDDSNPPFTVNPIILAGVEELFVEDNYKPASWLTLIAGERQTHFQGAITENAIYPRVGIAVQIPKLNWVFRGFYGHFYQPPPLTSITGPALSFAQNNQDSYVPLKGERNESTSSVCRFPFTAGSWMPTPSRPRRRTSSTITTLASPASLSRSPFREPWCRRGN